MSGRTGDETEGAGALDNGGGSGEPGTGAPCTFDGAASTKKMTGVAHLRQMAVKRPATDGRTRIGFAHRGHLKPTARATTECSAT